MWWFLGALGLLLAALLLESGLLAYAMYVLLALLLVTRYLARSWAGHLSAERVVRRAGRQEEETPDEEGGLALEIGERLVVVLTVSNAGVLPIPWVLLEDILPNRALDPRQPKLKLRGKRMLIGMVGPAGTLE
ncbi:MAG: hypothetical protein U0840_00035, partial [Gemmataceae bacterium]